MNNTTTIPEKEMVTKTDILNEAFIENNSIIDYNHDYDYDYDFNLNSFKSKSGNTHRCNKQNSKKKSKNMSIYSAKHVRIQSSKKK